VKLKQLILFSMTMLVILPLVSLVNLALSPGNALEWAVIALQTTALFLLNRLVGRWYWLGQFTRHLSLTLLVVVMIYSWFRLPAAGSDSSTLLLLTNLAILALWLFYLFRAISSARPAKAPYALAFPLKGKNYYTNEGGSLRLTNNHHTNQAQRYALDFYQLDSRGKRCKGFYPKDLNLYTIFGKPLFAPKAGFILKAVDGHEDMTPPEFDEKSRAGNHVLIKTDDSKYIVMAHLKKGSVVVNKGDRVEAGTLLGEVGSSGRSEEPHLHIHCMDSLEEDYILRGNGIPIQFDGHYLVRNQLHSN